MYDLIWKYKLMQCVTVTMVMDKLMQCVTVTMVMVTCWCALHTATPQRCTLMGGEWRSSTHGWSKTCSTPPPLPTVAWDHGLSPTATDPCTVPTLMAMTAPPRSQLFEQGKLEVYLYWLNKLMLITVSLYALFSLSTHGLKGCAVWAWATE